MLQLPRMPFGRIEEGSCAHCSIREMVTRGCCVQDHVPDELVASQKTIVNRKTGHKITACYYLDPTGEGNRCMNPDPPEDCLSFPCGR